jgi:hypothetical protein
MGKTTNESKNPGVPKILPSQHLHLKLRPTLALYA